MASHREVIWRAANKSAIRLVFGNYGGLRYNTVATGDLGCRGHAHRFRSSSIGVICGADHTNLTSVF